MKYKTYSILIFTLLVGGAKINNISAQSSTPFKCVQAETAETKEYEVYIFSHPGCGYSKRAFNDLGKWAADKPVSLIALNTQGDVENIKTSESYAIYTKNNIRLLDGSACAERYKNLVPQIFIYRKDSDKAIMKLRGWGKDNIEKVKKKMGKYL